MQKIADRIKELSATTGTGPMALLGALTGFLRFSSAMSVNDTCYYAIEGLNSVGFPNGEWEVGNGTYSAANTLTRTTVLASSNAGAAVNFSVGSKYVWLDISARQVNRLKGITSIKDGGAVVDGVTNDATAVAAALAAASMANAVLVQDDANIGTARVANERGVRPVGPGRLVYTPSATLGARIQNAAGRDNAAWGAEYLYKFLAKMSAGTAATIRLTGDSTTSGGYSDALIGFMATFPNVTITKAGQSGKHTGEWVSTYLAADITAAPDVLIWHWGMNDCSGLSRTLTQFETDLRAGLTTYRATIPIASGGIVLMAPNASSDGTNGRDELRNEKMRQIIRNAATDFSCAFFDTYSLYQDAYVGIGTWVDNTYGDGLRGVHPGTSFSQAIAGELLDLLVPKGIRRAVGDFGFTNSNGSTTATLPADALSTYPAGISIRRALGSNGWPMDGWIITFSENTNRTSAVQILYTYSIDVTPYLRTYSGGAWGSWAALGVSNVKATTAPLASAASSTYPFGVSIRRATLANGWPLDGYVITTLQDTGGGNYAVQINHQYSADVPPQMRTWISGAVWGVWRSMGSTAIAPTNRYVGNGSGSVTAHTIGAGIKYTYILNNTAAAAYALTLPAATDGAELTVVFANATGAITYNVTAPATATVGLVTPAVANVPIKMVYHVATTTWYPA